MITLGRRGDLHARRQATAFLRSRDVVHKLFAEVAPRFKDRPGGYSRIIRIGPRAGDAAEMVYLELVDEEYVTAQREERTPERPAVVVPEAEAEPVAEDTVAEQDDTVAEEDDTVAEEAAAEDAVVDEPAAPEAEADAEPEAEPKPES
jgi:large subunit ribosomal protein L17